MSPRRRPRTERADAMHRRVQEILYPRAHRRVQAALQREPRLNVIPLFGREARQ